MNDFAMFTPEGNNAVAQLVTEAKQLNLAWPAVYFALRILARNPNFGEATDTAVRECVYDACGFDTPFYI
jgi:hypothetical protein